MIHLTQSIDLDPKYQGRRRVFKSGPAEEIIECRRHERVEIMREDSPSL